MTTDLAKTEAESGSNPFGAFAKIFSALAEFFSNPHVQEAGRKLFAELEDDDAPALRPSRDPSRPFPTVVPPIDLLQLGAGKSEGSPEE